MGNKIRANKSIFIGILMMVASVISVFAFSYISQSKVRENAINIVSASTVEDWSDVYTYTTDSSTSTVTITGLKEDYATLDGLVIPSYIAGNPVKIIGDNTNSINPQNTVKNVYFDTNSQVTEFHTNSFSITSLEYIQLPESLVTMRTGTFSLASKLKYLNFPRNFRYFGINNENGVFQVNNLQSVDVDANNPYFTVVDDIIYSKDMTKVMLVPGSYVGELSIPNGVTQITRYSMFQLPYVTKLTLPNTLVTIGGGFLTRNTGIEDIIIPDSVTSIGGYSLMSNNTVKTLKLSAKLTTLGDAFAAYCSGLTSVVIPEGITTFNRGFTYCSNLSSVVLPSTLVSVKNSFTDSNITHIQRPNSSFTYTDSFTNKNGTEIVWHDSENMFVYTTVSDNSACINGLTEEGKLVTGIRIPDIIGGCTVNYLNATWAKTMSNVTALSFTSSNELVHLQNWGEGAKPQYLYLPANVRPANSTWGITTWFGRSSIKYFFVDTNNQYIKTNDDNTMILSKDGTSLYGHVDVYSGEINVPSTVTNAYMRAFYFESSAVSNVTAINGLENLTWPNSGSAIGGAGLHIQDITIPASNTNVVAIYVADCPDLTTVRYAEGITTLNVSGFTNYLNVVNIVLPKSLTLIKTNAFKDLKKATTVLIPSGCTVEEGAFPDTVTLVYEDDINWEDVFTYATLSDNTYTITGIKNEYAGLRSVTIPAQIGGVDVTEIRMLSSNIYDLHFASNSKVKAITQWNGLQVTKVKEITLPASFTGLYSIHEMSNVNSECLENIYVEEGNPYFTSIDGIVYSNDHTIAKFPCGRTGEYTIPSNITEIGASAFQNSHLDKLYIPSNVKTIQSNGISGVANVEFADDVNFTYLAPNTFNKNYGTGGLAVFPKSAQNIIEANAFGASTAEAVLIPANITRISYSVFNYASNLKYLIFLGSNAVTIGSNAFKSCTSLPATVVLPDGSTWADNSFPSNVTNVIFASDLWKAGNNAGEIVPDSTKLAGVNTLLVPTTFGGNTVTKYCGNGVSMPDIGAIAFPTNSSVTYIDSSAFATKNLKYLYLPSSLTTMSTNKVIYSRAEGYDYPLESLYIPNNLELPVTTMLTDTGYYGGRAQNGRIVDMPNISEFVLDADNPRYKLIDGNLYTLDGTTLVATVKNDTGTFTLPAGVTTIGTHAFYQSAYSHINLNNGSLTTIYDGAFAYCNNLISIALPSTITDLSHAHDMFAGCAKLEHVEVPNNINLGAVQRMFALSSKLVGFRYSDSSTASGSQVFYAAKIPFVLFNEGMAALSNATFHGSNSIQSITLPSTLTSISGSALALSTQTLQNIYIHPNNTSFVISDGILYTANMKYLIKTTIDAPNSIVAPNGVEKIYQEAFDGHPATEISLPNTLRTIDQYAFTSSNFTEIVIPEGVTTIYSPAFSSIKATSVTLPGTLTTIPTNLFSSSNNLTTVTLGSGTTTIESRAFNNLSNLETVNIPASVTTIAGDAFYNCPKLQLNSVPSGMTRIENGAFKGNTAITSIFIPNTVVYVGKEAFMNCTNLETVEFEAGSPLTSLSSSVFRGCSKLRSVVLPNNLQTISKLCFYDDISLRDISLPSTVTSIGASAFCNCSSLTAINLPVGLTAIDTQAFMNSGLISITIPSTVNSFNANIFGNCESLKTVVFNNNTLTTIPDSTFANCTSLESVVLPTSITLIDTQAFLNTPKLKTINLPEVAYSIGKRAFCNTGLESVYLHKNVGEIGDYAFAESKALKTVEFASDYVRTTIGGHYTFKNCTAIESVVLPATLTSVSVEMFYGCTKLSSVTGYSSALTYICNNAFNGCSSLTYFDCSHIVTFANSAFANCTSLSNIVNLNAYSSQGGSAFRNCTSLNMDITLYYTSGDSDMFNGSGIRSITFAEGITTIPAYICCDCTNLVAVNFPSSVTRIKDYAFSGCTNLQNVELNEGLDIIDRYAFNNCSNAFADTLVIPSTLRSIGTYAFYNCFPRVFDLSGADSLRRVDGYSFACESNKTPSFEQTLLMPDESNSVLQYLYIPFCFQHIVGELNIVLNDADATVNGTANGMKYITSLSVKNIYSGGASAVGYFLAASADNLERVYFGSTINTLETSNTFNNSTKLKSIYLDGAIGQDGRTGVVSFPWGSNTFASGLNKANVKVYVAAADVSAYQADSYWSAFNVLPHTTTVTVSYHSLFGILPGSQQVQVGTGRATPPSNPTCPQGYTFKGFYLYDENKGYTKIEDFSKLAFYEDATIFMLWDIGDDIVNYLTFTTTTYNGTPGYMITGYTNEIKYFPDLVIPKQYNGMDIIGIHAFQNNGYVNQIDFTSNSALKYLANSAFYNCSKLSKIILPASIREIDYSAFLNTNIKTIAFRGNPDLFAFAQNNHNWQGNIRLECFELIDSTNYVSENGIIYTSDYKDLCLVPRAYKASSITLPNTVLRVYPYCINTMVDVRNVFMDESILTHIYEYSFYGTGTSNGLSINDGILNFDNLERIEGYTFRYSTIKSVTIGDKIQYFHYDEPFSFSSQLTDFYLYAPNATVTFGNASNSYFMYQNGNVKNVTFVVNNNRLMRRMFYYTYNIEYIRLGDSSGVGYNDLFTDRSFNKLKTIIMDGYPTNSSSSLFNNLPDGLTLIVKRNTLSTWQQNLTGFDLSRFNIVPDEVEVTYHNDYDDNNCYSELVANGDSVTPPIVTVTKAEGLYDFLGWYYRNESGAIVPYVGQTITSDVTINAVYDLPTELLFVYEYNDTNPSDRTAIITGFDNGGLFAGGPLVLPTTTTHDTYTYRVVAVGDEVFQGKGNISSIVIPEGYVSVGDYAFESAGLHLISLPTTLDEIGEYAFANNNLQYGEDSDPIHIYGRTIGTRAFSSAGSMNNIQLHNTVTIGDSAFEGINDGYIVHFPDSLQSIGNYAFANTEIYWDGVTHTTLDSSQVFVGTYNNNDYNFAVTNEEDGITFGSSLHYIGQGAFKNNYNLLYIYFGNNLDTIGAWAFENTNLAYVRLPISMDSIGEEAFADTKLYKIQVPYGVELGEGAFHNCQVLKEVYLIGNMEISENCFRNCHMLEKVTFGSDITVVGDSAFRNTESLVYLLNSNSTNDSLPFTYIGEYAFANSGSKYDSEQLSSQYSILIDTYTNNVHNGHRHEGETAYIKNRYYSEALQDLFDVICDEDGRLPGTRYTFEELCSKWEEHYYNWIVLATFDTYEEMVETCLAWAHTDTYKYVRDYDDIRIKWSDLTLDGNTIFDNFYLPNIEEIGEYAFSESGVRYLHLGSSLDTIQPYTFEYSSIETMDFDSYTEDGNVYGLTNIYARAFQHTYHLQGLELPDSFRRVNANAFYKSKIRYIDLNMVDYVAGGAFNYTRYLSDIRVNSANSDYRVYEGMLFYTDDANKLNSLVYFPYTLTDDGGKYEDGIVDFRNDLQFHTLNTIYDYAFASNDNISELYFPSGLKLIKDNAFLYCPNLDWLQLPGTIEKIDEIMYTGSQLLIDGTLAIGAEIPTLVASGMRYLNSDGSISSDTNYDLTIYVPSADYERYKQTVWGVFDLVSYEPGDKIVLIHLELNGGTGVHQIPALIGQKLILGSNPMRNGYKFGGWYWDEDFEEPFDAEDFIVEESFTLYAKWNPLTYHIQFHMNGATDFSDPEGGLEAILENDVLSWEYDYSYLSDGQANHYYDMQLIIPEIRGYNFKGWYRKENFESEAIWTISFLDMSYRESRAENDIHLYARFERIYYEVDVDYSSAYEIGVIAGYAVPVEYGDDFKFTIIYHEGYDQNYTNSNITLTVTTTSEIKDDNIHGNIDEIEIGTVLPWQVDEVEGIRIYTITNPRTDIHIAINNVVLNTYTVSFVSNLSAHASGLEDMPDPIVVNHGQAVLSDYSDAEYSLIMYGTLGSDSTPIKRMLLTLFGKPLKSANMIIQSFNELEHTTKADAYVLRTYESYTDMMSMYDEIHADELLYYQIRTYNPNIRIETYITGIGSVDISSPHVNGYTFRSWDLMTYDPVTGDINISTQPFNFNEIITSDITLAATWDKTEYTITLYLLGGSLNGGEADVVTINYTIEDSFMLPYNSDTYKQILRLGYAFDGWYLQPSGEAVPATPATPAAPAGMTASPADEEEIYNPGAVMSWYYDNGPIESISAGTYGNKVFAAKWRELEYDIIYQMSTGGYFPQEVLDDPDFHDIYTVNSDFDLPTPVRRGYKFEGWYLNPEYTGSVINHVSPGVREGDLVLFAKWSNVEYNIVYNLNGNNISEVVFDGNKVSYLNNTASVVYTYNEVDDTPLANDIQRTGYTFDGWYSDNELTTRVNYVPAGTSGAFVVYAKWNAVWYSIALDYGYDKSELVNGINLPDTFEFTFEDFISHNSLQVEPTDVRLVSDALKFVGWVNGSNSANYITPSNYDITRLSAMWRTSVYKIFIASNNTYYKDGVQVDVNDIVRLVGEDGDITNAFGDDIRFMLYYKDRAFSNSVPYITYKISASIDSDDPADWSGVSYTVLTDPSDPSTISADGFYTINTVAGNLMLFVDSLAINTYTVEFFDTVGVKVLSDASIQHGGNISNIADPTRAGETFGGWYLDSDLTIRYSVLNAITSNLKLYAKFTNTTYYVTLKNNKDSNTLTLTYTNSEAISFVTELAPWEFNGYHVGRYEVCNAGGTPTGIEIQDTRGYAADIIVCAMYIPTPYRVTYAIEPGIGVSNDPRNLETYTIESAFILYPASKSNYRFDYWTDINGNRVESVSAGNTGDLVFTANFTLNSENYIAVSYYDGYTKLREDAIYKGQKVYESNFPVPDKDGYIAIGWFTDENLTQPYDYDTELWHNLTLYAKYNIESYDITYTFELRKDGVKVRDISSADVINIIEESFDINSAFRFSAPLATGLMFEGWYYNSHLVTSTNDLPYEDCELKGVFTYVTYSIVYTIPEGMAEGIGENVTNFNIDTPTITLVEPEGVDEQYDFVYWVNTLDMSTQIDTIVQGTSHDVFVTAVFVAKENYVSVQFYIGGTLEKSVKVNKGEGIAKPTFTRAGYVLADNESWYLSSSMTGTPYDFNETVNADLKLYAKWSLVNYTVQYGFTNNPSYIPTLPTSFNITSVITLPVLDDIVGYRFDGWWENVTGTFPNGPFDFTNATQISAIKSRTENLQIVAKFVLADYTISYDYDKTDGIIDNLPTSYSITDSNIDLTPYVPTKAGYDFVGWSVLNDNTYEPLENNIIYTSWAKDLFIRAEYEYIPVSATLYLHLDGELYMVEEVTIGEDFDIDGPTMPGYTFDGWYANTSYTGDKVTRVTTADDTHVYGRMVAITYTITYNSNLPSAHLPSANITSYKVLDPKFELINPASIFGYTFDGWYLGVTINPDGSYNFDDAILITMIYQNIGNLTITAKFSMTNYIITYQLGYGENDPRNVDTYNINSGTIILYAPTNPEGKEFTHWEYVDGDFSETWDSFESRQVARNITLYARYKDVLSTKDKSEMVIIAVAVGGALLFFSIITYSVINAIKRKRVADAKRIQELLNTLSKEQSSATAQVRQTGYRDDFRI